MKQITLLICTLSVVSSLVYALMDKPSKYNANCEQQCHFSGDLKTPAFKSCVNKCGQK
ncbi:MAG: hypothetical protein J6U05_06730 [Neisseriaceae bacterium]|nr:hypothetical protein [Neisseriaceae bacterium]MBO7555109.1 hypothetical protein [Neisseriaceae bacterium]